MTNQSEKIVIKGITTNGQRFRPSDWAQRLATAVGTLGPGRRIKYHPKVSIALIDGVNSVVIASDLKEAEPMLYAFLINFAESNQLQIVK
ncbi:MAG: PhnO-like protein [Halothiobacillaceae bacterium]|nr:MAG: PhnO-like protein [Halothiobacillaceae bacterium]